MEVMPVAAGDQVIVSVTPVISWRENGTRESFRFVDAATKVTVPYSRWVDIGGVSSMGQDNPDIPGNSLSTRSLDHNRNFLMSIKADVK